MVPEHSAPPSVDSHVVSSWRRRRLGERLGDQRERLGATTELASLEQRLREISRLLHGEWGTHHLGNWKEPEDEFVYIVLSRRTAERAYVTAFQALKLKGSWRAVAAMSVSEIAYAIHGCGLERRKAAAILAGLRGNDGSLDTSPLRSAASLPDEQLFSHICSLPEVGPKSARCVMLYAFGRPVFPVDAHVGRVFARLGVFEGVGIHLLEMGNKARQRVLEDAVPPDLRYSLHVNLIAHGRAICRARSPRCEGCVLSCVCARRKECRR